MIVALGAAVGGGCSDDSGSEAAFCTEVRRAPALDAVLSGFATADPTELGHRLDEAGDAYGRLRDAAPDEIDGDTDQVVDLVDAVIDAVREEGSDPEAVADQLRTVMVDHTGAEEAAQAVSAYADEHCDVQLDPPPSE